MRDEEVEQGITGARRERSTDRPPIVDPRDGRLIYTTDRDGRPMYRSGTSKSPAGFEIGYQQHSGIALRGCTIDMGRNHAALGDPVLPYVVSSKLVRGGENPGPIGVHVAREARHVAPNIEEVLLDLGYTQDLNGCVIPLQEDGLQVTKDLKVNQWAHTSLTTITMGKKRNGVVVQDKVLICQGGVFHQYMPEELHSRGPLPRDPDGKADKVAEYDKRYQMWAWRPHGAPTAEGQRMICPFCSGHLIAPNFTPKRKPSPHAVWVDCIPEHVTKCCEGILTIPHSVRGPLAQPAAAGTTAAVTSYGRRGSMEGVFGQLKTVRARLNSPGYIQTMGLAAMQLQMLVVDLAYNINLTLLQQELDREAAEKKDDADAHREASTNPPAPSRRLTKGEQYARMKALVEQDSEPRSGAPPGELVAAVSVSG